MALSGGHRFGVEFGQVFPYGCYAVSEVTKARDFDQSTRDNEVQARDEKGTGLPVWQVQVIDADPEVRGQSKTVTVKISAEHQPVLPDAQGLPFTPVEFTGMTATPYLQEKGKDRQGNPRMSLAYSLRADGVRSPSAKADDQAGSAANGSGPKAATSASAATGASASAGKSSGSSDGEG